MDLYKKEEDILKELERPRARVTIKKRKKVVSGLKGQSQDVNLSIIAAKKRGNEAQTIIFLSENAKNTQPVKSLTLSGQTIAQGDPCSKTNFEFLNKQRLDNQNKTAKITIKTIQSTLHNEYLNSINDKYRIVKSLKACLMENPSYNKHMSSSCLLELVAFTQKCHCNLQQFSSIISLVLEYLSFCKKEESSYIVLSSSLKIDNFAEELGVKWLKLKSQVFFINKYGLRILDYLVPKVEDEPRFYSHCYLKLKFDMSQKETRRVAKAVKQQCGFSLRSFVFLSSYLVVSCRNLEKSGQKPSQISKVLEDMLDLLAEQNPPAPVQEGSDSLLLFHPNFKTNENEVIFKQLDIRGYETHKRQEQVDAFILERAKEASNQLNAFNDLIKDICLEEGYHYRMGLKIRDEKHKKAIDRVKEKMFGIAYRRAKDKHKRKVRKSNKTAETIEQFIKLQQYDHQKALNSIYAEVHEIIKFKVDDLLRARCIFSSIQKINNVCTRLKENIAKKGYLLLEVKNRLRLKTSDICLKIQLGSVITQLQLAIDFKFVDNEFNHKLYELLRSNFYSPLTMLFLFNADISAQFLPELHQIISINLTATEKEDYQERLTYETAVKYFKQFLQLIDFKIMPAKGSSTQIQQLMNRLQEIQNAKSSTIPTFSRQDQLKKTKNDAKFYYTIKQYRKAYKQQSIYCKILIETDRAIFDKLTDFSSSLASSQEVVLQNYTKALQILANISIELQKKEQSLSLLNQYLMISNRIATDHTAEWLKAMGDVGWIYFKNGKYDASLEIFYKCYAVLQKCEHPDPNMHAKILNFIGGICKEQGKYDEAIDWFKKALVIVEDKIQLQPSRILNNIAVVLLQQGYLNEAIQYFQMSCDSCEKEKGIDSIQYGQILHNLGVVYMNQGNPEKSRQSYMRYLEIIEKIKGRNCAESAVCRNNIGLTYFDDYNYPKALEYLEAALKITERTEGKDCFNSIEMLNNIGLVYLKLERNEQALALFKKCIQIYQKQNKEDGIKSAAYIINIGQAFCNMDQFDEALSCYNECLKFQSQTCGQDSIDVGQTLLKIGVCYISKKRYTEAISYLERSKEIFINISGKESVGYSECLNFLGSIDMELGQYEMALEKLNESLAIQTKCGGKVDAYCAIIMNNIGMVFYKKSQFEAAHNIFTACYNIFFSSFKQNNILITHPLNNIANIYNAVELFPQAEANYKKCIEISIKVKGQNSSTTAKYQYDLGRFYLSQKKWWLSLEHLKRSLRAYEKVFGKLNADYAKTLLYMAYCKNNLNLNDEAEQDFHICMKIYEQLGQSLNPQLLVTVQMLGCFNWKQDELEAGALYCKRSLLNSVPIDKSPRDKILISLGGIMLEQHKQQEALNYFLQSLNIKQQRKDHDESYLKLLQKIIDIYRELHKEEVVEYYQQLLQKELKGQSERDHLTSNEVREQK